MGSVNSVFLVGHLGADPEVKYLQNNRAVCNLSVATSEQWKDKQSGEKKEKTEWVNVAVFSDVLSVEVTLTPASAAAKVMVTACVDPTCVQFTSLSE